MATTQRPAPEAQAPGMFRVVAGGSLLRSFWYRKEAETFATEVVAKSHRNIGVVTLQRLDWEYDWQTVRSFGTPQNDDAAFAKVTACDCGGHDEDCSECQGIGFLTAERL
ncbi:MAG TPA: hypothetical protein VMX74_01155 [Pirellulales bacterium]|nr:hypothetical protein [Pirellulales bacterium]